MTQNSFNSATDNQDIKRTGAVISYIIKRILRHKEALYFFTLRMRRFLKGLHNLRIYFSLISAKVNNFGNKLY